MQLNLQEKIMKIHDFLIESKMEMVQVMNYTKKQSQVEHNYKIIEENPKINLKEFQQKAIIIKD